MRTYFFALLLTSVFGAVFTLLAGKTFEKHMKYIASAACLCLMLLPFKNITANVLNSDEIESEDYSFPENATDLNALALAEAESASEKYICDTVLAEFGIKPLYADIKIDWEEDGPVVSGITVALPDGEHIKDVAEYLNNALGGEVKVVEG